jgi:hypothetical protein
MHVRADVLAMYPDQERISTRIDDAIGKSLDGDHP